MLDAVKAIAMFRKVNIDVLGMVENMSHFICPQCGSRHDIFGSGGARQKAAELGVPFLGEVPLNTQLRIYGDEGRVVAGFDDENSAPYLEALRLQPGQGTGGPPPPEAADADAFRARIRAASICCQKT